MSAQEPWEYQPPTEEEKTRLMTALVGGTVFTSQHLSADEAPLLGAIFMPLAFGCFSDVPEEEMRRLNLVLYEYLDAAGPRAINGHPCFFSMKIIAWDEWIEVCKRVEKALAAISPEAPTDGGA